MGHDLTSRLADSIYLIYDDDVEVTEVTMLLPGILRLLEVGSVMCVHLSICQLKDKTDLKFLSDSPKNLLTTSGPLIN